ncbi:hypothetical protein EON81_07695 [bacterium]|nr:MAG: hypothetical protein EON81_07695 [bacterium]
MDFVPYPRGIEAAFTGNQYVLKRKLLKLLGASFLIFDASGQQVLQANQKAFKLKEDIRLLGGPNMDQELVGIFARKVIDFSAVYDVVDLTTNEKIGALGRKGWKSLARDEWTVLDPHDRVIGTMIEDSLGMAVLRRVLAHFIGNFIPQNYDLLINAQRVVDLKQNFNPFSYHLNITFETPPEQFDRRLGLAAAVLLAAIEGKQRG